VITAAWPLFRRVGFPLSRAVPRHPATVRRPESGAVGEVV